jgi:hypothetical protein
LEAQGRRTDVSKGGGDALYVEGKRIYIYIETRKENEPLF